MPFTYLIILVKTADMSSLVKIILFIPFETTTNKNLTAEFQIDPSFNFVSELPYNYFFVSLDFTIDMNLI